MKKHQHFISALALITLTSSSCAQKPYQEANLSAAAGPELRWKYETGG